MEESTEQQGEETKAETETVNLTEAANNSTEGEIPETEAATEDETNTEEATEDNPTDSDIVDLNNDNTTEETNECCQEDRQPTRPNFNHLTHLYS